jgi:hemolysin III
LLYLSSTLYHALPPGKAKRVFGVLDHGAIFLLIAGTYTPFTLGVLRGAWGWMLLGLVWGLAALGLTLRRSDAGHTRLSIALYLAMGWLCPDCLRSVAAACTPARCPSLAGRRYRIQRGRAFFVSHRLRYGHFTWHLFVLVGTTCHFFAVLGYAT